jgi:hypothetical protein
MTILGIEMSEEARNLLGYLNARGGDFFAHVAERNGMYYVIPSPTFNWDSRIQLPQVQHPEAVQELETLGFLKQAQHQAKNPHIDYSPNGVKGNNVFSLTKKGKEAKKELFD